MARAGGRKPRATDGDAYRAGVEAGLAAVPLTRANAAAVLGYECPSRFDKRRGLWLAFIEGYRVAVPDAEIWRPEPVKRQVEEVVGQPKRGTPKTYAEYMWQELNGKKAA
jgi:hypothetical protein